MSRGAYFEVPVAMPRSYGQGSYSGKDRRKVRLSSCTAFNKLRSSMSKAASNLIWSSVCAVLGKGCPITGHQVPISGKVPSAKY